MKVTMSVVPIRRIPVMTVVCPEDDLEPLGVIAAETRQSSYVEAVDEIERQVVARAQVKFPGVTAVYNLTVRVEYDSDWRMGETRLIVRATGDVYGRSR